MKTGEKQKKSAPKVTAAGETAECFESRAMRRTFPRILSRSIQTERPTSHDFLVVFVSDSSSPLAITVRPKSRCKSHFHEVIRVEMIPAALGTDYGTKNR